jgi:hypothetical protein
MRKTVTKNHWKGHRQTNYHAFFYFFNKKWEQNYENFNDEGCGFGKTFLIFLSFMVFSLFYSILNPNGSRN